MQRLPSESDRRVKLLVVTAEGQAIYEQVRARADDLRRELIGRIAPERVAVATSVLEELQSLIENS